MHRLGNDTYTLKMTQAKLLKKCDDLTKLVARNGKGNIILLERVGNGVRRELSTGLSIESESIVKTAAKFKKKNNRNYGHVSTTYPTTDDKMPSENDCVTDLLQVF